MAGIYIHIPFCKQACTYCNFHFSTSRHYQDRMVNAIINELTLRSSYLEDPIIESIYLGGGTPSLLTAHQLNQLFNKISELFNLKTLKEVTLEANPDDLNDEYLRMLRDTPIDRLSIGIQSFFDRDLEFMTRAHSAAEAHKCLELAMESGFDSITIDLIYGSPTTTMDMWEANIRHALHLGIKHISGYHLTVEPRTVLHHLIQKGKEVAPDDVVGHQQFELLMDITQDAGWLHYEISNYAASQEYVAVHNSNYWLGSPYLGIGPSAHSYNQTSRSWNVANNAKYMKAIEAGTASIETEVLDTNTRYNELVMVGLRTQWGIPKLTLASFGQPVNKYFNSQIKIFIKKDWVTSTNDAYILTNAGKFYADSISSALMYV